MQYQELAEIIQQAFNQRENLTPNNAPKVLLDAVNTVLQQCESGHLRAASQIQGQWQVHAFVKQAILLYFRLNNNTLIDGHFTQFYDKIPLQFQNYSYSDFEQRQLRIVPPACVRKGAFIGANTILMPSYVNIGAYIGEGTLVDTWATVGSCAQIGKNVHLSGGVGIGGVLEPLQANPTIIEDNCFIGARSEIVEGVIVEQGAVISMGVYIGQSTRIYDRENDTILYGRVPKDAVVVPGTLPAENGKYHLYCAVIVKRVDEKTRAKVGINQLLRTIAKDES
ncbi:MAG: 2,3,4,5-tetrahydropyridine-2,6-dicarboxylate N-succinyltransferase [Proteobacteria bacterium]|nr:2,3,4,5-tetrahydropyridine-2,6-dicarboxylate N-succinyltransferase [Pseudomonadota bacterium]